MSVRRLLSRRHRARYRSLIPSFSLSPFLCLPLLLSFSLSLPPFLASNACWKSMIPSHHRHVAVQRSFFRPSRSARNETAARVASITQSWVLRVRESFSVSFYLVVSVSYLLSTLFPVSSLWSVEFFLLSFSFSLSLPLSPLFQHREFRVRGCVRALERERKNVVSSKSAAESFTEFSEFSAAIFCCSRSYVRCGTFNISVGSALLHKDLFPTHVFSLLYCSLIYFFPSTFFRVTRCQFLVNLSIVYIFFCILPSYRFIISLKLNTLLEDILYLYKNDSQ